MANRPLSSEFINKLIKKVDAKLPGARPIFTEDEHNVVRAAVTDKAKYVSMRGKVFNIRYFTWRKEDWITVRPVKGFVPMFSMPRKKLFDSELEI